MGGAKSNYFFGLALPPLPPCPVVAGRPVAREFPLPPVLAVFGPREKLLLESEPRDVDGFGEDFVVFLVIATAFNGLSVIGT